eukprot:gene14725-20578_t
MHIGSISLVLLAAAVASAETRAANVSGVLRDAVSEKSRQLRKRRGSYIELTVSDMSAGGWNPKALGDTDEFGADREYLVTITCSNCVKTPASITAVEKDVKCKTKTDGPLKKCILIEDFSWAESGPKNVAKTLRIYPTERNADLTIKLVESDTQFGDDDVVFELAHS